VIRFTTDGIEMSVQVAKALLDFASTDSTRTHLHSFAVADGDLCATDGHTLVRIKAEDTPGLTLPPGKIFPRGKLEVAMKVATATKQPVQLPWSDAIDVSFPPVAQAEPSDGCHIKRAAKYEPIGMNAHYLARLETVAKACAGSKRVAPVQLVSFGDPCSPVRFKVGGETFEHTAWVTIMPIRV
jgi:hypothetical protein